MCGRCKGRAQQFIAGGAAPLRELRKTLLGRPRKIGTFFGFPENGGISPRAERAANRGRGSVSHRGGVRGASGSMRHFAVMRASSLLFIGAGWLHLIGRFIRVALRVFQNSPRFRAHRVGLRKSPTLRRVTRRRIVRAGQTAARGGRFVGIRSDRVGGAPIRSQGFGVSIFGDGAARAGPCAAVFDDGAGGDRAEGSKRCA